MAESFFVAAASNAVGTLMADVVKKPLERYLPHLFGNKVSSSDPNPDLEFSQKKDLFASKSYTSAFGEIMDALKDDKVSTIGVWGMGGVGKTTLVSDVGRTAKALLSPKVIMVVVSQTADIGKIQDKIADSLNFKFQKNTQQGKAGELWVRLEKEERLLIVFDDMWKKLSLMEIGIPLDGNRKGCKIILTTRRKQVCESMASQATVSLGVLDEDETWGLFKTKALLDKDKDDAKAIKVAKEVAKECKGLPVAIVTLASSLKGTKTVKGWEVALKKLRSCRLMEIRNIEEEEKNAYMCLETSYEYLKRDTTKKCFLLCGLYPEDHSIYAEELVRFAWGLKLYPEATSIEEVRFEVLEAIDHLQDSCLLLEDDGKRDGERYIKLHDIVRDVAELIATDIGLKSGSKKKLEILLHHMYDCNTPIDYFEEMRELKVLKLEASDDSDDSVFSLNALKSLTNLRALQLEGFYQLEDISALAKLTKLEILHLHGSRFEEYMDELRELKNLKVLDMRRCELLSGFPRKLIRRFEEVEELYLYDSRREDYRERSIKIDSAILFELKFLPRLAALSLQLPSLEFPQDFLFPRLQRYHIAVNTRCWNDLSISSRSLSCKGELPLNVVSELLWNVEFLEVFDMMEKEIKYLTDTTPRDVPVATILQNLKKLTIENCENLQVIFQVKKAENHAPVLLSKLKILCLKKLPNLEYIWKVPTQHISLGSLEAVSLYKCEKLKSVFSFSLAQCLVRLEKLVIEGCDELQQIVEEISPASTNLEESLCLSKLRTLEIWRCDSLEYIFPKFMATQLTDLWLTDCPELTDTTIHSESAYVKGIQLSKLEGSFINTKDLWIENIEMDDCNLIPEVDREGLNELIHLQLGYCDSIEYLVDTTKEEHVPNTAFTNLEELFLQNLCGLKRLCNGKFPKRFLQNLEKLDVSFCDELEEAFQIDENLLKGSPPYFSLRSLKVVNISECRKLKSLFSSSLCLPRLTTLRISKCRRLEYVIPITLAEEGLPQLEKLQIESCGELKHVFAVAKQHDDGVKHRVELPCLTDLKLKSLRNLRSFGPKNYIFNSPALKKLIVSGCPQVMKCTNQEEVNNHWIQLEKNLTPDVEGLTSLELRDCKDIECLADTTREHVPSCGIIFTNLVELAIENMIGLKMLFNGQPPKGFLQNLKKIIIRNCGELQEVYGMDHELLYSSRRRQGNEAPLLSNLESLELLLVPELRWILKGPTPNQYVSLRNLKVVKIVVCNKLVYLFSFSLVPSLRMLKELSISNCDKLEFVFAELESEVETESSSKLLLAYAQIDLPRLQKLQLLGLKNLSRFGPENNFIKAPALEDLEVKDCPRLTNFSIQQDKPLQSNSKLPDVPGGSKVMSSTLKTIKLDGLIWVQDIWKGHIQVAALTNLEELEVNKCNNLTYIFLPMLVRNLRRLSRLVISECEKVEQIIVDDDDLSSSSAQGGHDKEILLMFPRFLSLWLEDLPSLKSFIPVGYHLLFPDLDSLNVKGCSQMITSFTVDSMHLVHAKTKLKVTRPDDPSPSKSDIYWKRPEPEWLRSCIRARAADGDEPTSGLPRYVEEADEISTMK